MSALRIVLVTRRYWPLGGSAESFMMQFADGLRLQGHRVQILTAQWESHWPSEVMLREVQVTRLPHPIVPGWRTFRYLRALSRWLRAHAEAFDVVYVAGLRYDAYAAVGALRRVRPVVLRADGSGDVGDREWHNRTRFGNRVRHRCMNADAIVAPSVVVRDELAGARFATNLLHVIPHGVAASPARVDAEQQRALSRQAIAEVNRDLTVEADVPVAISICRLQCSQGVHQLLRAWQEVIRRFPAAQLWIFGDGPDRDALYEVILDLELRDHVVMPGTFDVHHEILAAANLYVSPQVNESDTLPLLEAMATGVPVVAMDTPTNQTFIRHEEHGLLVAPGSPQALAAGILRQMQQGILAQHWAAAASERVKRDFTLEQSLQAHLELFEKVLQRE